MENVKFIGSFRFKLILILLLLVQIPLIAFSFLIFTWVKDIIGGKFSESALQSIRQSTRNIDYTLNDLRNSSNVILTNKNFINLLKDRKNAKPNEMENMVRGFFTSSEDIDGIYIYSGPDSYSIGSEKVIKRNDNEQWYKELLETEGEVKWINTRHETIRIMSGSFEKYYFSLGRKLVDIFTLEELGILLIDIDESKLEDSYKSQIIAKDVEAFICDKNGDVISHTDKKKIGTNVGTTPYIKMVLDSSDNYGAATYKSKAGNKDVMVIYSTSAITGWKLVSVIPSSYLYQEINKVKNIVLIIGLALSFFFFVTALFLSHRLTKPIMNLMKTMKEAEDGNLDVKMNVRKVDEIGQLGLGFNNMIFKIKTLVEKIVEEEKLKKEIELEALHAQINPHFLYNTLNSVKWMAKMQGAKNISLTITALIKLLRISINLSSEMVLLKDEIEYVKNYVFIQKIRFNEQFDVIYFIDESCSDCKIPKLILQPIVENSIVHGFNEEEAVCMRIEIRVFRDDKNLLIEITDNGMGIEEDILNRIFEAKDVNKFSTVGLNNVNERIKLYFGDSYGIKIISEVSKGTCVKIVLPYIINEGEKKDVQDNDR